MGRDVQEQIRAKAKSLLESGDVKVVIGWTRGSVPERTAPVFVTRPEDCAKLVWNRNCKNNLAVYLGKKEVQALGKPAIVAKGCDSKSIVGLIQEHQVTREGIFIIGVACEGIDEPMCADCEVRTPHVYDEFIGEKLEPSAQDGALEEIEDLEKMEPAGRWEFWKKEFERCIKCYACRTACPLCYCTRCIVDKNQPQWISPCQHARGNLSWNIIRAMHLAGRCVGCGACARACPMDIKIDLVNRKLAKVVQERFDYKAGKDIKAPFPMASFKLDDKEEFIQ
ncbi:4Fe-4S binding protein [Fibrobacterota bacterium]